jgi:hypothetical protein
MTLATREQTPISHETRGYTPLVSSTHETHFAAKSAAAQQTHFGSQTAAPEIMAFSTREVTPLGNERDVAQSRHFVHEAEESLDEVTAARDRRLELLARQFVGESSPEDDARFYILTQRLRRLVPSVSDHAWQALDSVTSTLEGVSSNLDELKKQFDFR